MNRASMLRLVACGIIGLGAALLIAALLLSTYTAGQIRKIPLDIDATLMSQRHRNRVGPRIAVGETDSSSTRTCH